MTDWVRLWHDMPTDPKWRVVARKSGQPLPCVIALFTLMMTTASAADERGSIEGLSVEDAAAALDMDEDDVAAIFDAMVDRVVENGRLSGWERRQPKREDGTAAERKKAWKERQKAKSERGGTQENAAERAREETDTDTDTFEDKPQKREARAQPVNDAIVVWNDAASAIGWPTVSKINDARKAAIRARLREDGIEGWASVVGKARASPFLCQSPPPGFFNFDWLVKPANYAKVSDGNYENGRAEQRSNPSTSGYGRTIDALSDFANEVDGSQWN